MNFTRLEKRSDHQKSNQDVVVIDDSKTFYRYDTQNEVWMIYIPRLRVRRQIDETFPTVALRKKKRTLSE